jgi:hypothetical protein
LKLPGWDFECNQDDFHIKHTTPLFSSYLKKTSFDLGSPLNLLKLILTGYLGSPRDAENSSVTVIPAAAKPLGLLELYFGTA